MSNPVRHTKHKRGSNKQNIVFSARRGKKVRAPRPGKVVSRKGGFSVITKKGTIHRFHGAKLRKGMAGKQVNDQAWVASATGAVVRYSRYDDHHKQMRAGPVLKRKVVPPPPKRPKTRKPWNGTYRLTAGFRYSSGAAHFAWDIGCPIGTNVYAPIYGVVAQMNDGVHNNVPGRSAGSGSPSNFVYIHGKDKSGNPVSVYLQHLNKGVLVHTGQTVKPGDLVGHSGNSGNSFGPHLHIHAMRGHMRNRYQLYSTPSVMIYPPSKVW